MNEQLGELDLTVSAQVAVMPLASERPMVGSNPANPTYAVSTSLSVKIFTLRNSIIKKKF
jgi:hypothetical protein